MREIFIFVLVALLGANVVGATTQAESRPAAPSASLVSPGDDLLGLLPESDLLATIDLPGIVTDLVPRLEKLGFKGLQPISAAVKTLTTRLGITPRQIGGGAIGLSFQSFQASGVLLLRIPDLDPAVVDDLLRQYKIEYRSVKYDGVTIIALNNAPTLPALGPLTLSTSELAYALLGQGMVAIGELSLIRKVIDRRKTPAGDNINLPLISALREEPAGQLRFSFTLTSGMREEALNQGDLFRSIAAVKVTHGSLRVSPDLATDLNITLKTSLPGEAVELEQGLKGLLNLARVLLANGNQLITDILGRARLAVSRSDVSINLALPSDFIERIVTRRPQ